MDTVNFYFGVTSCYFVCKIITFTIEPKCPFRFTKKWKKKKPRSKMPGLASVLAMSMLLSAFLPWNFTVMDHKRKNMGLILAI